MSWRVDPPVRVGEGIVAAIVETRIDIRRMPSAVIGRGNKRPVLYLLWQGDRLSGVDVQGQHYTEAEIERRYPGAIPRLNAFFDRER